MGLEIHIPGTEIGIEYNDILALRKASTPGRKPKECLPEKLMKGMYLPFHKEGWRIFPQDRQIPLVETYGNQETSEPIAYIFIKKPSHQLDPKTGNRVTIGHYRIEEVSK